MLNPMRQKIEWALAQPGVTPARLVELTGVKGVSAISEWKRTGRVAKKHIPTLAAVTGTQERWWLTEAAPMPPTAEWMATEQDASAPSARAETAARWTQESIPDSPGAVSYAARLAVEFLRHHAEALSASDRRMVASLLASYVGDDDAGEQQLEAICVLLGATGGDPRAREYDGSPSGPSGRTFGEGGHQSPGPRKKTTGRRKK